MHWLARGALAAAALSLVGTAALSRTAGILCNTAVVAVLAVLMLRARRGDPQLRPTRTWMLAALVAGFTAGVAAAVDSLLRPGAAYPRAGDVLELLYIPCTLVALMLVPLRGVRRGFRARALSDGLVAASSLLFLLEPLLDGVPGTHTTWYATAVALGIPLGGAFIVAAALTAFARCTYAARPMLLWLSLGVSMMATADFVYAVAPDTAAGPRRALLQLGLTTLIGAAVARRGPVTSSSREVPPALAALPFLPFAGAVLLSTRLVLTGNGLDPGQLVLAILVALALVLRQYVGNRDKTRLVKELAGREARLHHELRTDRLTSVANRLGLEEALTRALHAPDHAFGLVVVDLDDFKLVNDNHGHATGDAVLREVARRLMSCVRGDDVVARLGGDEFAVLLNGDEPVLSAVSERLVEALAVPVLVGERPFRLSASVGLVRKEDGDTVAQLLADADGAMYEAKADRSASSLVHLDRVGRQSVAWRSLVREQVAHPVLEQFEVQYQPVVDLVSGALCGMEALLRWNHPTSGLVPPDVFIPLAEQCGSITALGDFVLTTAVRDLATLARLRPGTPLRVGVNVSPRQLASSSFAERVEQVLGEAGVAPDQLIVEITEQAFETDLESLQQTVRDLIGVGVELAVDDFGTGYASLQYLQRLDLSLLKVDRTFVAGLGEDGRPERLLDGIAALAHRMNLELVAEGIETPEQLALLRTFGCELGQGFLFDRPLPLAALVELVRCGHVYDVQHPHTALPHPRPSSEAMARDPAPETAQSRSDDGTTRTGKGAARSAPASPST